MYKVSVGTYIIKGKGGENLVKTPAELLAEYQRKVKLMTTQRTPHKDVQPLTTPEILLFRALLHPTNKKESKDMTRELVNYLCEQGITSAEDIYTKYNWSDKPVMRRLKLMREFGMVKREQKKYYMPTPRLFELQETYLKRVCD